MYKFILATRYLIRRRITYFAVLAVALCVFIVVVVMTILTGIVRDFKQKNHSYVGDCIVHTESLAGFPYYEEFSGELEKADFVECTSTVIKSYGLLSPTETERNYGIEITGIDPARHRKVTGFGDTLHYNKAGAAELFKSTTDPNIPGCVLGIDLALQRGPRGEYTFGTSPLSIALAITCFPLTAKGALAKAGAGEADTKIFSYCDTSRSGLAGVDSSMVYLPFEETQVLCMAGTVKRASAIQIKFKPDVELQAGREQVASLWAGFREEKAGEQYAELLDKVNVQSWKEYRRAFIAPLEKEQAMMMVLFALVGITTAFIVLVVFYMLVSHKSKDIGILKSIGASRSDVLQLFCVFASLVGLVGSFIGVLGGWLFLLKINAIEGWLFEHFGFQIWDRSIYVFDDIPNEVQIETLAVIIISAIAVCLAGALIPGRQAAKLRPVETLQVSRV